jgi:hypothetical protein
MDAPVAPLPKMSFWNMSESDACGSTEKTRTLCPCRARWYAAAAEKVVLPSPPLPPNMTYFIFGWVAKTSLRFMMAAREPSHKDKV